MTLTLVVCAFILGLGVGRRPEPKREVVVMPGETVIIHADGWVERIDTSQGGSDEK